jgi:chorismate dehydratase
MNKIRVSVVSYLNSKPFLYGLQHSPIAKKITITTDIPSKVAGKLTFNQTDIGLIPVAGLDDLNEHQIVGNYCIGAVGKVRTVVLVSNVPLDEIETVLMDYQSRSSVLLAKVLARFYWEKQFQWENTCNDFQNVSIGGKTAGVVIGDRVFNIENRFRFVYDLSEEWQKFTGLPFVFAVWAANKKIEPAFEREFNSALELGLKAINEISLAEQVNYPGVNIAGYFDQNISFDLNQQKRAGMNRFLELARKLEPAVSGK